MNEPDSPFKPQGSDPIGRESSKGAAEKPGPASTLESTKTHERHATDGLKTAARAAVEEYRGKAEQALGNAQERVRSLQEEGEQYVRENPTKTIISVLGIGFLLGLIIRR